MEYTLFNDTYVMYQLLDFIDESSIIALCKASKKLNEICKSYIELEDDKRFEIIVYGYNSNTELLEEYCIKNDIIKVRKLIKMNIDLDWHLGFEGACRGGHLDCVKLMIVKGAHNYNNGLQHACQGGHLDIVRLMIEKGANWWNGGLMCACEYGQMDIVKLMIKKGADDWHSGLYYACRYNHMDIVQLMIEKDATECYYCQKSIEEHLKNK